MKTSKAHRYMGAWQHHASQLATLALTADVPAEEYFALQEQLSAWIDAAASRDTHDADRRDYKLMQKLNAQQRAGLGTPAERMRYNHFV